MKNVIKQQQKKSNKFEEHFEFFQVHHEETALLGKTICTNLHSPNYPVQDLMKIAAFLPESVSTCMYII